MYLCSIIGGNVYIKASLKEVLVMLMQDIFITVNKCSIKSALFLGLLNNALLNSQVV